ncbi:MULTISPECIES: tripartite tricarboxylate transporter substrate binding protein [unclassified Comamonas]|uniref:tripartite tricarboxylate transporter substrate binding protein n=1 Tax=unclassified Comamonas TaxID=2638500 RepID=UPI001FA6C653|nr:MULTISPECIES: tripartite tricarboxylate transporter substrate binding protein [unclassified Comamonas]UNV88539.1 tripartite tricarboxylate transporter substrate binding protein [Comamonas sp. 7D-2evo1]UNV93558.1 tripartite tricarboxylate transporter substrate binding protein [Comamonas sp. 7D-2]UNV98182.1 tripartite tricarboxylate transporter substrate binding protein [Comamonas sp. 7D-2evo2]
MNRRHWILAAASAASCLSYASDKAADATPIKLVVPYTAGGAADYVARVYAEEMGKSLKRSIVVENRPGAGGAVAGAYVAREKPDGNTLMLTSVSIHAINPTMAPASYDPNKDLAPIAIIGNGYTALVVSKNSRFNTLSDLINYGKANPDKLSYGSSGNGSITHLSAIYFLQAAGIKALHAPYRGNPQVMTDLVGGLLDFTMDGVWITSVKGGNVKALAYAAPKRNPAMPHIPIIAESGVSNYEAFAPWIGFVAPSGTPQSTLELYEKTILEASHNPAVSKKLADAGIEPESMGRASMQKLIQRDVQRIGDTVRKLQLNAPKP